MTTEAEITFSCGDGRRPAFLATPDGDGPHPGVIVVHEVFGLNQPTRDVARRLAEAGYVALAVDLFADLSRGACMARLMATLVRPLNNDSVLELKRALDHLSGLSEVDAGRVGAIGFCLGGALILSWSTRDPRLRVISPYYGRNPPLEAVRRSCAVVGSYPGQDFTARDGRRLEAALTSADIDHDIEIYPGARHSFANPDSRNYNAEAAEDAWRRTLDFFGEHMDTARPSNARQRAAGEASASANG